MGKPKVVLIVEDKSDGTVLKVLAAKLGLPVVIDYIPANGIGNIKSKGQRFIQLARARIEDDNGCIAVLIDSDGKDPKRDEPYKSIRQLCQKEKVAFLTAVQTLEAWFLADAGCAKWLTVQSPRDADKLDDPKKLVATAYQKKHPNHKYQERRARLILAQQCDGTGPEHSPSMKKALLHLQESPCMQE